MKLLCSPLITVLFPILMAVGCGENEDVVTTRLETSFKSADTAAQASVAKAVAAIKSGDHSGALSELEILAGNAKLTPEQRDALRDVITQVKKVLSDTAKEAVDDARKSLDKIKKSLPK